MADCRWCRRHGFFLSVNASGLCKHCEPILRIELRSRQRVIDESLALVAKSSKLETRLSRCDVAIAHLSALIIFETRFIPTTTPPPSSLRETVQKLKKTIFIESMRTLVESAERKAEHLPGLRAKVTALSKALLVISNPMHGLSDLPEVGNLKVRLKDRINSTQLNSYLEEARKAEFKGQKNKAAQFYYDALYHIQHDDIEDQFQEISIDEIKKKIEQLTGKPLEADDRTTPSDPRIDLN